MSILLGLLNFVLLLTSVSLVLVVLMQKTKDGGMGAALGGGATESAFGHETGNVLSKFTINAAVVFFVLSFVLYLGRIYQHKHPTSDGDDVLQKMAVPAATPATTNPLSLPGLAPSPASGGTSAPGATTLGVSTTGTAPAANAPVVPAPAEAPKPATP
ncbi:MAG: preprotein translocase subunit SecG [Verrucomicrobiota bacterium]